MNFRILLFVLLFAINACSHQVYVADIDTSTDRIGKWYQNDDEIDEIIAPYKAQLDAQMNTVLAYNSEELKKDRPSSPLGNWFCDVLLNASKDIFSDRVDFVLQNYGGIRIPSLSKGDVLEGDIYELMPFDNKMVLLKLDGNITKMLLDRVAEKGGWPSSRGLSMSIENNKAVDVLIQGKPFDKNRTYHVVLADYIANGGDRCFFLKDQDRVDEDVLIRDAVIDYLKKEGNNAMNVDHSQRITFKK